MNRILIIFAFVVLCILLVIEAGWIDPDTPVTGANIESLVSRKNYDLVFSDEFNVEHRNFHDGNDPKWTAMHKDDYTNFALQYYNADLINTKNGYLNISTIVEDIHFQTYDLSSNDKKMTKHYQSGMLQGWNKFCFTGGIVEISAKLPGNGNIGGLWPAMWMLGNLARATYVGSSNNIWPWSYDTCNPKFQQQQSISACNVVNHFDLKSKQGRGSPEIDILEAMPGPDKDLPNTHTAKPYFSTSLQISPGIQEYRPNTAENPVPGLWYEHDISYGKNTSLNIFFYGMHLEAATEAKSYFTDALSANRNINDTHFEDFHKYRIEWKTGEKGYIAWFLDDEFVYRVNANALNKTDAIIPEEPMYLLFNTAISSTWGFPTPCPEGCPCDCFDCRKDECLCAIPPGMCANLPADFLIDYVRVYQDTSDKDQITGCSTPTHPTKRFIQGHKYSYMKYGDTQPLLPIVHGGGQCEEDVDCGRFGKCVAKKGARRAKECVCKTHEFTGPNCLAAQGYDDIDWDPDEELEYYSFLVPHTLVMALAVLLLGLIALVIYRYYHNEKAVDRGEYSIIPNAHVNTGYYTSYHLNPQPHDHHHHEHHRVHGRSASNVEMKTGSYQHS